MVNILPAITLVYMSADICDHIEHVRYGIVCHVFPVYPICVTVVKTNEHDVGIAFACSLVTVFVPVVHIHGISKTFFDV